MTPAITVENLGKSYRIGLREQKNTNLREALIGLARAPIERLRRLGDHPPEGADVFWALRGVGFEVQPGEVVGIMGRNGAGKSTLLKVLSRIVEPTEGRAVIRGRVGSLLEVGTGFHQELTGRENIYLNGAILGMSKVEIDRRFDQIVEFSGVEKFLDTPVKHYSSGMRVRLGFAVAAHLEPEILIVDEVLAVGDAEFQNRCMGKMRDVAGHGRTVLFVSHNMAAVRALCTRGIVLGGGKRQFDGAVDEAIDAYLGSTADQASADWRRPTSAARGPLSIESIALELGGAQPRHRLLVHVELASAEAHPPAFVAVDFFDPFGGWLMQAVPTVVPFITQSPGSRRYTVEVDLPPLVPGRYPVGVWVGCDFAHTLDSVAEVVSFDVERSPTPGRTVAHNAARGRIVPVSRVVNPGWTEGSAAATEEVHCP